MTQKNRFQSGTIDYHQAVPLEAGFRQVRQSRCDDIWYCLPEPTYTYTYIALLLIYLAADYEQLIRQSGRHRVSHE